MAWGWSPAGRKGETTSKQGTPSMVPVQARPGAGPGAFRGRGARWAGCKQNAEGGVFAGGGSGMWKDTGIAMFSMVRQAELGQDRSYFRRMTPNLLQIGR